MRNDPEFCFYGRKYDDSRAGSLEDEDSAPVTNGKEDEDEASEAEDGGKQNEDGDDEQQVIWKIKSKLCIGLEMLNAFFFF